MSLFRKTVSILSFAALTTTAACATDAPTGSAPGIDDAQLNLVAEAHRDNGNVLRIYEPMPGQLLSVEIGPGHTMPMDQDAVALFRAAEPTAAVPAVLAEAQLRARTLRLLDNQADTLDEAALSVPTAEAVDTSPDGKTARASSACEINTFIAQQCTNGDQEWCKINWTNGFWAYNSSVNVMHNAVCPKNGTVRMRLIVESDLEASFPVSSGQIGKVAWIQRPIYLPIPPFYLSNRFNFRTEITEASGNTFHVGGAAYDE